MNIEIESNMPPLTMLLMIVAIFVLIMVVLDSFQQEVYRKARKEREELVRKTNSMRQDFYRQRQRARIERDYIDSLATGEADPQTYESEEQ